MRWEKGKLFKINLDNGQPAYALTLQLPEAAFFDHFEQDTTTDKILSSKVLWRLWIMKDTINNPSWQHIADVKNIPEELMQSVTRFKKDRISGKFSLYKDGIEEVVPKESCVGFECAAVWSAIHVHDRLKDYLSGTPNKWELSMAIQTK